MERDVDCKEVKRNVKGRVTRRHLNSIRNLAACSSQMGGVNCGQWFLRPDKISTELIT